MIITLTNQNQNTTYKKGEFTYRLILSEVDGQLLVLLPNGRHIGTLMADVVESDITSVTMPTKGFFLSFEPAIGVEKLDKNIAMLMEEDL